MTATAITRCPRPAPTARASPRVPHPPRRPPRTFASSSLQAGCWRSPRKVTSGTVNRAIYLSSHSGRAGPELVEQEPSLKFRGVQITRHRAMEIRTSLKGFRVAACMAPIRVGPTSPRGHSPPCAHSLRPRERCRRGPGVLRPQSTCAPRTPPLRLPHLHAPRRAPGSSSPTGGACCATAQVMAVAKRTSGRRLGPSIVPAQRRF